MGRWILELMTDLGGSRICQGELVALAASPLAKFLLFERLLVLPRGISHAISCGHTILKEAKYLPVISPW